MMQLISFYFIILLNGKISKFKDLEVRQNQLIREMDDTISLYLVEMKEENNRFLSHLSKVKTEPMNERVTKSPSVAGVDVQQVPAQPIAQTSAYEQSTISATMNETVEDVLIGQTQQPSKSPSTQEEVRSFVPKNVASRVYGQQVKMHVEKVVEPVQQPVKEKLAPFEQQVVDLHKIGMSIDDIAKKMQKGKTEIELLIKFHA